MIQFREVNVKQEQKIKQLWTYYVERYKAHQKDYLQNAKPQKLIEEKRFIDIPQIPALDFIVFVVLNIRKILYGLQTSQTTSSTSQSSTIKNNPPNTPQNQIDQLYQFMHFLIQKFHFANIIIEEQQNKNKKPKILPFEIKDIKKDMKLVFSHLKIISQIQQTAKNLQKDLEQYLLTFPPKRILAAKQTKETSIEIFTSPLQRMLQNFYKNYPWDLWKKQYVMKNLKSIKEDNVRKNVSQLNFLELLLISYSRQQLKNFLQKNPQSADLFVAMLQAEEREIAQKEMQNQIFSDVKRQNPDKQSAQTEQKIRGFSKSKKKVEKLPTRQQLLDDLKQLRQMESKLKQRDEQVNKQTQNKQKIIEKETLKTNQIRQRRERNLAILQCHRKRQRNAKVLDIFFKLNLPEEA